MGTGNFSYSPDHGQDSQPYPVDAQSTNVMTIHSIHTYSGGGYMMEHVKENVLQE